VGAELLYADTQTDGRTTDMTKLIIAFLNFAKVLKNMESRNIFFSC